MGADLDLAFRRRFVESKANHRRRSALNLFCFGVHDLLLKRRPLGEVPKEQQQSPRTFHSGLELRRSPVSLSERPSLRAGLSILKSHHRTFALRSMSGVSTGHPWTRAVTPQVLSIYCAFREALWTVPAMPRPPLSVRVSISHDEQALSSLE
jgi:hypothetical protein